MYEVFLSDQNGNWSIVDVDQSFDISSEFSVAELNDIALRNDTISTGITFPGTRNNNLVFGNLFRLDRSVDEDSISNLFNDYKPNIAIRCQILENGVQVIQGNLYVENINIKEGAITYSAVLTGDIITLFKSLKDSELTDLEAFDKETHYFNSSYITASWNSESRFVYGHCDYGINTYKRDYDIRNYRPAIRLRAYLQEIFKAYNLGGSFTQSDEYNNLIIPHSEKHLSRAYTGELFNQTVLSRPGVNLRQANLFAAPISLFPAHPNQVSNIETIEIKGRYTFPDGSFVERWDNFSLWTWNGVTTTQGRLNVKGTITTNSRSDFAFKFGIYSIPDGVDLQNFVLNSEYIIAESTVTRSMMNDIDISVLLPFKEYTGRFTFGITLEGDPFNSQNINVNWNQTEMQFIVGGRDLVSYLPVRYNDEIRLSDVVPVGIKQKDFVKSVMNLFNLYLHQSNDDPETLLIDSYDQFYSKATNPAASAKDWTQKLDNSNIDINTNNNIPTGYKYTYQEDNDNYLNNDYKTKYAAGYGDFEILDENGRADVKPIEVIFASTINYSYDGDDKIKPCLYKIESDEPTGYKSPLRLLYFNGLKACDSYRIMDGNTVISTNTTYPYCSMISSTKSLLFGKVKEKYSNEDVSVSTLFDNYYSNQIKELSSSNLILIEGLARLNVEDINQLDLTVPVYLNTSTGAAYFKVVSVTYHNQEYLSTIILQKIVN